MQAFAAPLLHAWSKKIRNKHSRPIRSAVPASPGLGKNPAGGPTLGSGANFYKDGTTSADGFKTTPV